ncbi:hypothetical protein QE177_15085 (plasmid) [Arsenophonus sp. aPb]|uniref:hypothetical protein n=1 Tax=Arsenophonus sp. aPb TaxID=3041619 RepID=UPI0024682CD9|nr:hypothetical protein [Arsenophonus sp. aPb]WGL99897.1 hypothetical protein QE177_15085 [Arsenophonus sp. aPb]
MRQQIIKLKNTSTNNIVEHIKPNLDNYYWSLEVRYKNSICWYFKGIFSTQYAAQNLAKEIYGNTPEIETRICICYLNEFKSE